MSTKGWTKEQRAKYQRTVAARKKGISKSGPAGEVLYVLENGTFVPYRRTIKTVEVLERIED